MDHIKRIGAGFLDSMGANRNKAPPDDLLVSCKKQLTDLRDEIMVVKLQFAQYAHQVVEASEGSVTLAKSVAKFYSRANHPGRSESVNMYKKVQEDIANNAVNTFHITVENGLITELAEWIQLTANLTEKIENAESTRTTAHDTDNRLTSLQNEFQDKKSKKQGLFGGSRENELEDLQQRIAECTEAKKSLTLEYQKARNSIAQQVKQLMEKRYRYFDRIYVQMLECQAEYFQHAATVSKRFQRDIDYYRRQYPKTKDFSNSNGSLHILATQIQKETSAAAAAAQADSLQSVPSQDDIVITAKTAPKPNRPQAPKTQPPPQPQEAVAAAIAAAVTNTNSTTAQTSSTSSAAASSSSGRSSPIHADSDEIVANNSVKAQSSPPVTQQLNGARKNTKKPAYNQQQSTHDILNLGGPASPPPPQKQPSLLTAMFGNQDVPQKQQKQQQKPHHDPHGIFNLANPDHNDMLHGFDNFAAFDDKKQSKPQKPQKAQDPNDIFSDFMAFGAAPKGTKNGVAHHGSVDSTSDWLLASHNPAEAQSNNNKNNINNNNNKGQNTLEQQMNSNFNQPSYGGGHDNHQKQQNGNISPKIKNSTTRKIDTNGTSVNVKSQMANLQLSDKGRINAEKEYTKAMALREEKQKASQQKQEQRVYFKDKHDKKLNEWEFEDGVRRNIRTLIGKLPDVLPDNFKWKPIPISKLLNDAQLKKGYYKAVRIVHPDKSIGRGDTVENQVICDYVFQALEQAFNTKFG